MIDSVCLCYLLADILGNSLPQVIFFEGNRHYLKVSKLQASPVYRSVIQRWMNLPGAG